MQRLQALTSEGMRRAVKRLSTRAGAALIYGRRKRTAGTTFDRLDGLGEVLAHAKDASVLDIGSCDGLVAYEFARWGARLIHGLELDVADVAFARRLFRDVPIESAFLETNLARPVEEWAREHAGVLQQRYDITLFLGVFHHLERQMDAAALDELVAFLLERTERLFVVRTRRADVLEPTVLAAGFERIVSTTQRGDMGPLRAYERR